MLQGYWASIGTVNHRNSFCHGAVEWGVRIMLLVRSSAKRRGMATQRCSNNSWSQDCSRQPTGTNPEVRIASAGLHGLVLKSGLFPPAGLDSS